MIRESLVHLVLGQAVRQTGDEEGIGRRAELITTRVRPPLCSGCALLLLLGVVDTDRTTVDLLALERDRLGSRIEIAELDVTEPL